MRWDLTAGCGPYVRSVQADDRELHLRGLLDLAVGLSGADNARIVTPLDHGDHLVRRADGVVQVVEAGDLSDAIAVLFEAPPRVAAACDVGTVLVGSEIGHVLTTRVVGRNGECVAVLQLHRRVSDAFTAHEEDLAQRFAPCFASALAILDDLATAEARSRREEALLRHTTDGVIRINLRGDVCSCNDAILRILGYADVPAGLSITRLLGDMNGWLLEAIDRVAAERRPLRLDDVEIYLEHENRWIAMDVSLLAVDDDRGRLSGLMLVMASLDREKALRQAMARYVSPAMADRLLAAGDASADGRFQIVTVLFCDIRGFTGISEQIGAVATVSMLNSYFSYMEDVITNRGGTIDKYIGDAIMAVFGSPEPSEHDAVNGVRAATDMIEVLGILNVQRKAEGLPPMRVGIGLATGQVVAGNIGSSRRMDFTIIGDAVNLASRIEGMTKSYGADILIDGATARGLGEAARMRQVDRVRVKGQRTPTDIYQIATAPDADLGAGWKEAYETACGMYLAGEWDAAGSAFQAIVAASPLDLAARLMASRCAAHSVRAPLSWQGVTDLERK